MVMRVEVDGLSGLVNQLEKFSPDVSKALKSELRKAAGKVASASKSLIPDDALSNWGRWTDSDTGRDLSFLGHVIKTGVAPMTNRYRRGGVTLSFGYDVASKTPGGSIYEVAGPGTRTRGPAGDRFVVNLNRKRNGGPLPRSLYPAYYAAMPAAQKQIEDAVRDAERKVGR